RGNLLSTLSSPRPSSLDLLVGSASVFVALFRTQQHRLLKSTCHYNKWISVSACSARSVLSKTASPTAPRPATLKRRPRSISLTPAPTVAPLRALSSSPFTGDDPLPSLPPSTGTAPSAPMPTAAPSP
ncbi:hypothetical protein BC936DRAFT_139004, partial [Jimgerdemannia flammicorona]